MATDLLTIDAAIETPVQAAGGSEGQQSTGNAGRLSMGQGSVSVSVSANSDTSSPQAAARSLSMVIADYVQLTKPRIVVMILVTTAATGMIAAGGLIPFVPLLWLMLGTAAVAASAGAANQIWERSVDRRMPRTATRPLPDRRMNVAPAAIFTAALGIAGTWLLLWQFDVVPAMVGVVTWLLYVLVYTPMKTRTSWNTTVGAVAGALPVLIGYTALGGSLLDPAAWLLVGVLVAWQYPHFMAIAWMYRRQYDEAGFRMTTTVEPTGRSAAIQSVAGSVVLIICGVALCLLPVGIVGAIVGSLGVFASCYPMLRASICFALQPGDTRARKLLRSSLLVLPAVLAIVTLRVFW